MCRLKNLMDEWMFTGIIVHQNDAHENRCQTLPKKTKRHPPSDELTAGAFYFPD
jgi:hypothetical protein